MGIGLTGLGLWLCGFRQVILGGSLPSLAICANAIYFTVSKHWHPLNLWQTSQTIILSLLLSTFFSVVHLVGEVSQETTAPKEPAPIQTHSTRRKQLAMGRPARAGPSARQRKAQET